MKELNVDEKMPHNRKISGLTPRDIVDELGRYIMGQEAAKKAVAVAVRNRARRQRVPDEMRNEIAPKNIIMVGPTGVGKTEIARRLSRLTGAPFLKVEATKYTEVGYVGRDVESMIRDLVSNAVNMVREEHYREVQQKAAELAEERLLDILLPPPEFETDTDEDIPFPLEVVDDEPQPAADPEELSAIKKKQEQFERTREKMRKKLHSGDLDEKEIDIEVNVQVNSPMIEVFSGSGMEDSGIQNMLSSFMPDRTQRRRLPVSEAREVLQQQEAETLIDMDRVTGEAVQRTENMGIVFIDELDKIAGKDQGRGPDVSREGVQRDILPIIEGCTVNTRYGPVKTDHILFIAAGAFHLSKPSDLIPELQGRFPIRVELDPLGRKDLEKILTEPRNALLKQYQALLATEEVTLTFKKGAVTEIAAIAEEVNTKTENIGARRLHTLMEKLLEEISFDAPDQQGNTLAIDKDYVRRKLGDMLQERDMSSYIL